MIHVHSGKAHEAPVFRKSRKPILVMGARPENAHGIFNPATARNGTLYLYCREEDAQGVSRIRAYTTADGAHIDREVGTVLEPKDITGTFERIGYEDPRGWVDPVTGKVYLVFVNNNGETQKNCIAESDDYVNFRVLGPMFPDDLPDKDGAIMGRRPDGKFIAVRRPMVGPTGWGMRVAIADKVEGPYHDIAEYPPRADWEGERTGASEFAHIPGVGYIGLHHGAVKPNGHWVYSSGLDLFNEYGEMIASAAEPQLFPETKIEQEGAEGKAILLNTGVQIVRKPCVPGAAKGKGRKYLRSYAGAGDHCVIVAEASLEDCVNYLHNPINKVNGVEKTFFSF